MQQSGLIEKILRDVIYDAKKLATGRPVAIGIEMSKVKMNAPDERGLTLADTEGMFLLLAIGFLIAIGALVSEWVGGCTNRVMGILKKRKDDRNEAERIEQERIDAGEAPSRKFSLFSRRSSKPVKSKDSSPASVASTLSKQALKELFDGPYSRKSTMCFYNNALIAEDEIYDAQREIQVQTEILSGHSLPSTAGSSGDRHQVVSAEVNREPTPPPPRVNIGHDLFGEEILY